jgi:hypothetical protein
MTAENTRVALLQGGGWIADVFTSHEIPTRRRLFQHKVTCHAALLAAAEEQRCAMAEAKQLQEKEKGKSRTVMPVGRGSSSDRGDREGPAGEGGASEGDSGAAPMASGREWQTEREAQV